MAESQTPSNNSPGSQILSEEDLRALSKYTLTTKPTLPTPTTEVHGNSTNGTDSVSTALQPKTNPLDTYEKLYGGRQSIIDDLSLMALDKKQQHLLYLLCHPTYIEVPLSTIVKAAGLTASGVMDLFADAAKHRSQALGMGALAKSVPSIVGDIIAKSVDEKVECPECFGFNPEGAPCPKCNGKGVILRTSDLDRQKLVLEMTGLLKKGPATAVQINQNIGNTVQSGTFFSKFVKDTDETAYDVPIEGEIDDSEPKR